MSAAQTFRSATELVNLNVTVVGPDASLVPGLTSEQFEVREDGIVQPLKFFAAGETPVDVHAAARHQQQHVRVDAVCARRGRPASSPRSGAATAPA